MKRGSVLTSVLLASLGANAYLLLTRTTGGERPDPPAGRRGTQSGERPAGLPRRPPGSLGTAEVPTLASGSDVAGTDTESAEREQALAEELAKTVAKLEEVRPLNERFDRGKRTTEIEAQIRPILDTVFATLPGGKPAYAVECHDQVCRLDVDEEHAPEDWSHRLYEGDAKVTFRGLMLSTKGDYLDVASPQWTAGARYVQAVFAMIVNSPVVADCKLRFVTPGELTFGVVLEANRDVHVDMTGSLADNDLGRCVRPVADSAPSQLPAPDANIESLPPMHTSIRIAKPKAPVAEPTPAQQRKPARELTAGLLHK